MITGRKPPEAYADMPEAPAAGTLSLRALACLVMAAVIVLGGIVAAGGNLTLK
jgi:hypothetical protein